MKKKEKVHIVAFILVVIVSTIILNSPKNKEENDLNNLTKRQQLFSNYNVIKDEKKLVASTIEVGGDLDVNFSHESDKLTLLWSRIKTGKNTYEVAVNGNLVKTMKSMGNELFYTISYSRFKIGKNNICIKTYNMEGDVIKGLLFLNFEAIKTEKKQEITFSK